MINKEQLAQQFIAALKQQGPKAGLQMLGQYGRMLTPQEQQQAAHLIGMANKFAANKQNATRMNSGGSVPSEYEKQARVRRWLDEMDLSPRDEAILLDRLSINPVTRKNAGGHIPMYNQGGGLLNHPYEREGEQFDTVPAMLTPGEFVVDADSAHKFGDELEKINNWEPNGGAQDPSAPVAGEEQYLAEDEAVEIKRKFKDGTEIIVKSPEGSKTEVSSLLGSLTKTAKKKGYDPVKNFNGSQYDM